MDKNELRRKVREAKSHFTSDEKIRMSEPIMAAVERLPSFLSASIVLSYWSMSDEVYTHDFVERWYREKIVLLPCVIGDDLVLRQYRGMSSMHAGPQFGIPEPTGPLFSDTASIEMIVVPGMAFDRNGNRMGRGRGFYDRLLKTTPHAVKVGVAFPFQMFDQIPIDNFDVPMDVVISV